MVGSRVWIIGAEPGCDVVVEAAYVSSRHCRLTLDSSGILLEDLNSTNGTFVNGERLTAPRLVTRQDRITLGQLTALPWPTDAVVPAAPAVRKPAAAPSPPVPTPAAVPAGGGSSPAAPPQQVITIGRGPENDVVIDAPGVSTRHARILVEAGIFTLEDLGSTNGTFLNSLDNRVTRTRLTTSDVVYLGTEPVPAPRLLAGVTPAGAQATMAINVREQAALLAAARAEMAGRQQAAPESPRAGRISVPPPPPPSPRLVASMPRAVLLGAAGAILLALLTFWFARGSRPSPATGLGNDGKAVAANSDDQGDVPSDARGDGDRPGDKPGAQPAVDAGKSPQVADAVYAVLVERQIPNQGRVLGQIGSATAIGRGRLVTSAAVATEVRRHLAESWDVVVHQPRSKREFRVVQATVHPDYPRAADDFATADRQLREGMERLQPPPDDDAAADGGKAGGKPRAKEQPGRQPLSVQESEALVRKLGELEDKMLESVERQVRHDVGLLEVFGDLPAGATLAVRDAAVEPGTRVRIVAIPHSLDEKETKRDELRPATESAGRWRRRGVLAQAAGFPEQRVVLLNAASPENANLAGAAVVDDQGRLLAVYSRPTLPLKAGEAPNRQSADVVEASEWKPVLGSGR